PPPMTWLPSRRRCRRTKRLGFSPRTRRSTPTWRSGSTRRPAGPSSGCWARWRQLPAARRLRRAGRGRRTSPSLRPAMRRVDVAHVVATHGLTEEQPKLALWAAEKAIAAAPSEDKPRLDLARATQVMGDGAGAERYLSREVFNRSDDDRAPLDPSHRTKQVA